MIKKGFQTVKAQKSLFSFIEIIAKKLNIGAFNSGQNYVILTPKSCSKSTGVHQKGFSNFNLHKLFKSLVLTNFEVRLQIQTLKEPVFLKLADPRLYVILTPKSCSKSTGVHQKGFSNFNLHKLFKSLVLTNFEVRLQIQTLKEPVFLKLADPRLCSRKD